MPSNRTSHYVLPLSILLALFCFRVGTQLLQKYFPVTYLPQFDDWHSNTLPYSILFISQLLIISCLTWILWQLHIGSIKPSHQRGRIILTLGTLYFSLMLFRIIVGLSFASEHIWLSATIPSFFHLVLASFLLGYGHYHFRYGQKANA